jgi:hypothetical protein
VLPDVQLQQGAACARIKVGRCSSYCIQCSVVASSCWTTLLRLLLAPPVPLALTFPACLVPDSQR